MSAAYEVNFDGLVGPTHNYAGLAYGNTASMRHRHAVSNPRAAALEGLEKMKFLMDLGVKQAVLPPQERPDVEMLRRLGFAGSDARVLESAGRQAPEFLAACSSASSMWAANMATVSPSADCADGRLHLTVANLVSQFHRSLEAPDALGIFRAIFADESRFAVHPALPAAGHLSDEGAANHIRLAPAHGEAGLEIFVYGRDPFSAAPAPRRFPARQSHAASQAIARSPGLDPSRTLFLQQSPAAIDAGVFHNDVVAVGNLNVLLYHASAFAEGPKAIEEIRRAYGRTCGGDLHLIAVSPRQLSLADAVKSYLFNSQLVSLPDGSMSLICPAECRRVPSARRFLDQLPSRDTPIRSVHFVNIRQSMRNGGGPACLRLRIVLSEDQLVHIHPGVLLTSSLYASLKSWIHRHYRDRLAPRDLADVNLLDESRAALDDLGRVLFAKGGE